MTAWIVLNAVLSVIVFAIIGYKLACVPERFTPVESVGMGILAAGALLTIGPLLWPEVSPFDDWAASLFRLGCAIYFIGRLLRGKMRSAK